MKRNNIILISIIVFLASCDKQDYLYSVQNPIGPKIGDIISFQTISSTSIDADGFSLCTIKVKIHPEADATNRTVIFKVSGNGKFTNGDTAQSINVNTEGFATVAISNTKSETVHLKATVSTYTIDTAINFKQALPDDMQLVADNYVLDSSIAQPVHITAKLFRNAGRGLVTDGAKVFFKITPLDTAINFIYPPFQYSQNYIAVDTALNPFKVGGRFDIEAKTVSSAGDTLFRVISVRVK
jgi:hypothetical protein